MICTLGYLWRHLTLTTSQPYEFQGSERRSRERSTCLAWRVFICVSGQKWRSDVTFTWSDDIWKLKSISSIPIKTIECVCVSPASTWKSKFVYSDISDYKQKFIWKLMISGGQKVWILNKLPERRYISSGEGSLLTNILCRNCADKNKTVV